MQLVSNVSIFLCQMQVSMLTATTNKIIFLAFERKNIELFETRNFYLIFYSLVNKFVLMKLFLQYYLQGWLGLNRGLTL